MWYRDIDMHAISQSVDQNLAKGAETYAGALGSQSGIAGVRGDSNQTIECYRDWETDRKSTRLNSSHSAKSRMPSSA